MVGAVRADRRRAARAARLGVIANVVVRMELGSMGYTFSIQRAVGLTNHDVAVVGAVRVGALNTVSSSQIIILINPTPLFITKISHMLFFVKFAYSKPEERVLK